jgi:hypothetical protein
MQHRNFSLNLLAIFKPLLHLGFLLRAPIAAQCDLVAEIFPIRTKKTRPSQEGRAVLRGPNLLSEITFVAPYPCAEIPSENCEVADVQAAGP